MSQKTLEWEGRWFVLGTEEWLPGTLRPKTKWTFELDLQGSFTYDFQSLFARGETATIHGVARNGDSLTVEAFRECRTSQSGFGVQKGYDIRKVIEGDHLGNLDPQVLSLEFSVRHLHAWTGFSVFTCHTEFEEFPYGASHELSYREPPPLELVEGEGHKIHLLSWSGLPVPSPKDREVSLQHFTGIRIDAAEPTPFSGLARVADQTRALISFATSTSCSFSYLAGYRSRDESASVRKCVSDRINFFPVGGVDEAEPERNLWPHEMLFTLDDARENDFEALRNWYALWPKLRSVIHLYLGAMQSAEIYEEHRFLSLVQALEGFHRLFGRRHLLPKNEHKVRLGHILEAVPSTYRDFLSTALQHSNEPSLRERLDELLEGVAGSLSNLVTDPTAFAKRVVDTRHFLSHAEPGIEKRAASGWELFELSRILAIALEVLVLLKLGFSGETVLGLINRSVHHRGRRGTIPFILESQWSAR